MDSADSATINGGDRREVVVSSSVYGGKRLQWEVEVAATIIVNFFNFSVTCCDGESEYYGITNGLEFHQWQ